MADTQLGWVEVLSYLGSLLVFLTFFMKAIVPLRLVAIASNIAFIVYAIEQQYMASLLLHASLFPLNIIRVIQQIQLERRVKEAIQGDPHVEMLLPFMTLKKFEKGTTLFRKGDMAREMFYLSKGTVSFPEVDVEIGPGTMFGEIALFLQDRARTASAVCAEDCEIYTLSEAKVLELAVVDGAFGLFLTKLITARMNQNLIAARAR